MLHRRFVPESMTRKNGFNLQEGWFGWISEKIQMVRVVYQCKRLMGGDFPLGGKAGWWFVGDIIILR